MQKCFQSNTEFRNQFIVSAIKFGESHSKFMIPTALLEKFGVSRLKVEIKNNPAPPQKKKKKKMAR